MCVDNCCSVNKEIIRLRLDVHFIITIITIVSVTLKQLCVKM